MKKTILTLIAVSAAAISISAFAQSSPFAKPEDAVKYRKAALTVTAAHFGRLGAMAQGKVPFDAKAAAENADIVANMSKLPWAAFGEGTDVGETKAKPEIWKQNAKFKEASEKFQAEATKLAAAAKSGKEDTFKTAFSATAGTCKSCHDDFRAK
ncbi:cytochrome C [Limnohabitans sp. Rim8]|jgi:cytochrome c556|uniref:Cytochrome C n=1 Tax=Limnohabitans curvus TaxID=323423 RepID=A0A315EU40_9BURK|nr:MULTISPECIES: cytochrome c [Limnohabitans]PUE54921.1 cytochrome C [Limnohabitans sp. Rim8]PUE59524.1 cytochrome C [Limnohabitans curvus]